MAENNINCANYEFCNGKKVGPIGSDYCMTCGSWFKFGLGWNKLTIIDSTDECIVCMNECDRKLMFPTNCGHSFCLTCSKDILFWNEERYHLSAVPFGCPPCPNGCDNPIKGEQCNCEEYYIITDEWQEHNPEQWAEWSKKEGESIDNGIDDITYGKATCPLCRSKYIIK